jgi:hypothetical protein
VPGINLRPLFFSFSFSATQMRPRKDHRYNDLRIVGKAKSIKSKMDIQRAPNDMQRENCADVTALVDLELMLTLILRSKDV